MDWNIYSNRFPKPGETLLGHDFRKIPGGKGAGQAAAITRLGGEVILGGAVGDDSLGKELRNDLEKERVNTDYVIVAERGHTGVALIIVTEDGENSIVLDPGANMEFSPERALRLKKILPGVRIVLANLEVPLETIDFIFAEARKHKILTVLDAGPARPLPPSLLGNTEVISPNYTELEALLGRKIEGTERAKEEAEELIEWGPKTVILKLGEKGSYLLRKGEHSYFPAPKVSAVDTTAAGDAFMGALCFKLGEEGSLSEAVEFANLAGACAVTKMGSRPSLPTQKDVARLRLMADHTQ